MCSPGRWQLRVFLGRDPVTGKPKQISQTYSADRREPGAGRRSAEKKLAALVAAVERGEHGGSKATVGNLLDEWMAHSERMGRSPKTLHEYRRKIDKSITPTLGAIALDKLSARNLDRLYADQLAAGLSPSTVLYFHRIIGAAIKQGKKGLGRPQRGRGCHAPIRADQGVEVTVAGTGGSADSRSRADRGQEHRSGRHRYPCRAHRDAPWRAVRAPVE
jgi:hypothetical protein